MKRINMLIVAGLASAGFLAGGAFAPSPARGAERAPAKAAQGKQVRGVSALWVWRAASVNTPEARAALVGFAAKNGFNRLFVQVRFEPGSVKAGKAVVANQDMWKELITLAGEKGIMIEALDGDPTMARAANHAETLGKLEAMLAMNKALPEGAKLAGIHYDIEPYTAPAWKTAERTDVMKEFLDFFHAARKKIDEQAPGATLSADIPFWYDNKTAEGDTCVLEYAGKTKNFHEHIQDVTDYIGVMSYRRKVSGPNSVTAVVENELAYAAKIGKTVCPALETGALKETPTITFSGLPTEDFWNAKKEVGEKLAENPAYGGILVHSYENLKTYLGEDGAKK